MKLGCTQSEIYIHKQTGQPDKFIRLLYYSSGARYMGIARRHHPLPPHVKMRHLMVSAECVFIVAPAARRFFIISSVQ